MRQAALAATDSIRETGLTLGEDMRQTTPTATDSIYSF